MNRWSTVRAARMWEHARRLAGARGMHDTEDGTVAGAEHLFLAIIADEDGIPGQVLGEHADVAEVRRAVQAVLDSPGHRPGRGSGA